MKIKAIAKLIKDNKFIYTVEENENSFWLGNGTAIYLVDGLPVMSNKQLMVMFEIPEKEQQKYKFSNNKSFTSQIKRDDCIRAESIVLPSEMRLSFCGYALVPLITEAGLVCIEEKYLRPLSSLENGYELYLRFRDDYKPYIVAKDGMFLKAVILPCDIVDMAFCGVLRSLAELSVQSIKNEENEVPAEESFLEGE